MHRGDIYDDPVEAALKASFPGSKIIGSGSEFDPEAGVLSADLEFSLAPLNEDDDGHDAADLVLDLLEAAGAPRGSFASLEGGERVDFGQMFGIGVHLNNIDLRDEIYERYDVHDFLDKIYAALGSEGHMQSYWESGDETSIFIYGLSEEKMRELIAPVLATEPLAERCRVTQL